MILQKFLFGILFLFSFQWAHTTPLIEQLQKTGYLELDDELLRESSFEALYDAFDELIVFLQDNPAWAHKLYYAKERFIRSKDRNLYSTDVFGFYDDTMCHQLSFYYSTHFHDFICSHEPKLNQAPKLVHFLETCRSIQNGCEKIFETTATNLNLNSILPLSTLFKVIKYLPSYTHASPHYDGAAFSLFLNSTDDQSLLLAPYQETITPFDFTAALRTRAQNSILFIPGAFLREFLIDPTPHIVLASGKTRYATIAFAMRPNYIPQKLELKPLPNFNDEK